MIRSTLAAASVLGSAALAVAALSSPVATAAPTAPGAPTTAKVRAADDTTITKSRRHGHVVTSFKMVRSTASVNASCLPDAKARVSITSKGAVEVMKIHAIGLPQKTDFDLFVTQVPDLPFGLSWYQGDLESDRHGKADGKFIGRFSEETFTVAPGTAPAPVVHTSPIADAASNPATAPVHQYHLGIWFNSPADAAKAGCANNVTPFNGEHNAGAQALSTRQFPVAAGPLKSVES